MSEDRVQAAESSAPAVRDRDGLFRHNGNWHFRLKVAGKWRQFSTGTGNYNAAKRKRHDLIEQQIKGKLPSDMARWQLPKALEQWLEKRKHALAPSTVAYYEKHKDRLIEGFGNITLGEVTADAIANYQQARLAAGAAPRTCNMEVGMLRSVMIRARLWAQIKPDVAMLAEPASPGVAITREQEEGLLAACARARSPILHPFVVLAIETGARRGTLMNLQWRRVDFVSRCLQWGHDKTPAGTGRTVPLSARALATLQSWAEQFPNRQPEHFVFPTMKIGGSGKSWEGKQGTRKDAQFVGGIAYDVDPTKPVGDITSAWEAARDRASVRIRIHDLRHLAASRMLDAGVPLAKVAKILGWAPSTMVHMAARYGHFRLEELRDAVEAISAPRQIGEKSQPAASTPTVQ